MNVYEFFDESYDNVFHTDFLDLIGDDLHEEREDEGQYLLSCDKEDCGAIEMRGTSSCEFSTKSLNHFIGFYTYLLEQGFEAMILSDPNRYKVGVYGLTTAEASLLTKQFLEMRRQKSGHVCAQVA